MNDARLAETRATLAVALTTPLNHKPDAIEHMLNGYAAAVANVVSDSEAAAARGIIAKLKAQLEQARGLAVQLENENARLTDELAAVQGEHRDAFADAAECRGEIARLRAELAEAYRHGRHLANLVREAAE